MKILIALDESTQSQRAVDFVACMRWPAGSRVIVVSVPQGVPGALVAPHEPVVVPAGALEEQGRRLEELVAAAEGTLREAGLSTVGRVTSGGDPREALIEEARTERADLMVVGSHGRTGIARLLLGSVSSHVVTHAPCSVLVVKHDGRVTMGGKGRER